MRTATVQRVRLTFLDHLIKEPVIYQLGHKFEIVTNVRMADGEVLAEPVA